MVMLGLQVLLGVAFYQLGGWAWVFWGIFLRLVVVYHITWFVNSATHKWGYRNFETNDLSRNNWWVGILAWGEGWHNNHHKYQDSCKSGFRWWEIDVTYSVIKLLSWFGLAHSLKIPDEMKYDPKAKTDQAIPPRIILESGTAGK
jgi:stearoyl-CoA desaturase (delta-9 desaturase)